MSEQKHTQGICHRRLGRIGDGSAASAHEQICNSEGRAVVMLEHDGSLEANANVELILEAFNTAHYTGLTPRQLAEQRAELLEAARKVISFDWSENDDDACETINNLFELIKKIDRRAL